MIWKAQLRPSFAGFAGGKSFITLEFNFLSIDNRRRTFCIFSDDSLRELIFILIFEQGGGTFAIWAIFVSEMKKKLKLDQFE